MASNKLHVVTGAYGYSGRYIAVRLLDAGHRVRTLTDAPTGRSPFGDRVDAHPLSFDRPERLTALLQGATVLYNTYWVRFNYANFRLSQAIDNTRVLFAAARAAGIQRVVHVSITNPSEDSPFEYFRERRYSRVSFENRASPTRSSALRCCLEAGTS